MLLRFRVENHASIRDEQEISLVAHDHRADRCEDPVPGTDLRSLTVASVFGANASGKSNLIDALVWARHAVLDSFQRWSPDGGVPRRPFRFRTEPAAHPTRCVFDFVSAGVRYEYGFAVDSERVREEWFFSYPEGRRRRLFNRENEEMRFGRALTGRPKLIAKLLRPNGLYLSVAAAQGHELLRSVYRWFRTGLRGASDADYPTRLAYTLHRMTEHSAQERAASRDLLRFADLGVDSLELEEDRRQQDTYERLTSLLRQELGDHFHVEPDTEARVTVGHRVEGGTYRLPLLNESSGTRTWIGLVGPVLSSLLHGSLLFVDELDARLHPYLVDALVGMFQDPDANPRRAQLIFSTHEASLLGTLSRTALSRDQVWLTEKDDDGATRLFPLTEFQVRKSEENLERRYLLGRYGAVPYLDDGPPRSVVELLTNAGDRRGSLGEGPEAEDGENTGEEALPRLL